MIYIIIGTKAQLIKMAPVMKSFRSHGISYRFISTGQHRETMDDILGNFGLPQPDCRLYVGRDITSVLSMAVWGLRILCKALLDKDAVFGTSPKGIVLVHGDTFSTLLGAVLAKAVGLKVGHIEAGLRSFNIFHPFPEELIRLATFRLSNILFCPDAVSAANVAGCRAEKVDTGGNSLADALSVAISSHAFADVETPREPFAVVTLHRFENIYSFSALERVVNIVERIATHKHLVFILHPPTEKKLKEFGLLGRLEAKKEIELRQRYDYFRFIKLLSAADFVVSDGGSNQEECYYLGKPILLLRKVTERIEGIDENCLISGYDLALIDEFVDHWQRYSRDKQFPDISPSETICLRCLEFATPKATDDHPLV